MNDLEAAKLLTIAAGFDRRQVTEMTARAWAAALSDQSYVDCERAVIDHYRDADTRHDYLSVGHVLDRVERAQRATRKQIEDDVRSAKARGLIGRDWPKSERLPADVAQKLAEARAEDAAVSKQLSIAGSTL